jgi:pimeloyl-ACP methyl ester carboxylesterase
LRPIRERALGRVRTGLPEARIVPIPNATHGVLQDNPSEVTRILLDWLSELG